jgi:transcriptional regulator with XRE-family HTH domain
MYDYVMVSEIGVGIDKHKLEEALARSGMNAAELARASGVDKSTISKMLSGERHSTTALILSRLARALNVTSDYLLGLSDTPEPTPLMLGELLLELTKVARKLPNRRQRDLILMARSYLSEHHEGDDDAEHLVEDLIDLLQQYDGAVERDKLIESLRVSLGLTHHHRRTLPGNRPHQTSY